MTVQNIPLDDIKPYENNPRKNDQAVDAVAKSIEQFGFKVPLVIDAENVIVCGHTRYKAAQKLHLESVPCIVADDLTPAQIKAFRLVDNKTAELATWDEELLRVELESLHELDFEIPLSGFEDFDFGLSDDTTTDWSESKRGTLAERFLFPPFSILDTRKGEWQERKVFWIKDIGITSSETRENMKTGGALSGTTPRYYQHKEKAERAAGHKLTNKEFEEHHLQNYLPKDSIIQSTEDGGILSTFDPVLAELMYYWFCPTNGNILDPFAGGNVRGLVAALMNHEYTGVDIRQEQVDANIASAEKIIDGNNKPRWICGDSVNIQKLTGGSYDMIFSCPPYFDLEKYSDNPADLSNMNYENFLANYRAIIKQCATMLKDNRFAVFVVGDLRDQKTGMFRNFVSETIAAFVDASLNLYNEIILIHPAGSVPLRVGNNFTFYRKVGKCHQNVLVFYKGTDQRKIKSEFGEVKITLPAD